MTHKPFISYLMKGLYLITKGQSHHLPTHNDMALGNHL